MPKADLVIRNARLFDPRDLSVTPGTSVLVRGDRIVRVDADADLKPTANAEIIDAHGRFLMPGLWDNHQHFSDVDGAARSGQWRDQRARHGERHRQFFAARRAL